MTLNVPRMTADGAGAVTVPVGAVLSTRTAATVAEVDELPTLSVVSARRSYVPSLNAVVSQLAE